MPKVCFYFQVHQPYRVDEYSFLDVNSGKKYFDDKKNEEICKKVASKCYLPMNALLLELINKYQGKFKISFSITGTALEQFEMYSPETLESFKKLARTGCVEFLSETYYHSLSFLYSKEEFQEQVQMHRIKIKKLFNYEPKVFRNTELIFNNELAHEVEKMGYLGILAEGADHVLGWRSPNFLYRAETAPHIKLLLKNYKLSDDIAFRFSNQGWASFPLMADTYASWINQINGSGEVVNLFMDYETFGEHQWEHTGIFNFMRQLPEEIFKNPDNGFMTPTEVAQTFNPVATLDIHHPMSWADMERDLSAWLSNAMQHNAMSQCYRLESYVKENGTAEQLKAWRMLTTSDHFYYMCTKYFNDGDVHKYFSPYETPYEAFMNYMNILEDLRNAVRPKEISLFEVRHATTNEKRNRQFVA
jgi:alpha-amylase